MEILLQGFLKERFQKFINICTVCLLETINYLLSDLCGTFRGVFRNSFGWKVCTHKLMPEGSAVVR